MRRFLTKLAPLCEWLFVALLLAAPTSAQISVITDRALGLNPIGTGGSGVVFLSYGPVRVCNHPATGSPCTNPATVFDAITNAQLSIPPGANGQLTTAFDGLFSFGCNPGVYDVQVFPASSNTPQVNYVETCPAQGTSIGTNNTWTGNNTFSGSTTFTGAVLPQTVDNIRYARNFQLSTTSTTAVTSVGVANPTAAPTLGQSAGGTLATGKYFATTSWTTSSGETFFSPESNFTVTGGNGTLTVAAGACPSGATGFNAYISTTLGYETRQNGGTPVACGTTYNQASSLVAGAVQPDVNTTAPTVITPASMTNIFAPVLRASNGTRTVKQPLLVDTGGSQEVVYVTAVTSTTFTATFLNTHSVNFAISSATAGIMEAEMSISVGGTGQENGGVVILPSGKSIGQAPIEEIGYVYFAGRAGAAQAGDAGGNAQSSSYVLTGDTNTRHGAFQCISVASTDRCAGNGLYNLAIYSSTHGFLALGANSPDREAIQDTYISAPNTSPYAAVNISTNQSDYVHLNHVRLSGYYCVYGSGGQMIQFVMDGAWECDTGGGGGSGVGQAFFMDGGQNNIAGVNGIDATFKDGVVEGGSTGDLMFFGLPTQLTFDNVQNADWAPPVNSNVISLQNTNANPGGLRQIYFRGFSFNCANITGTVGVKFLAGQLGFNLPLAFFENGFATCNGGGIDFGGTANRAVVLIGNGLNAEPGASGANAVLGLTSNINRGSLTAIGNRTSGQISTQLSGLNLFLTDANIGNPGSVNINFTPPPAGTQRSLTVADPFFSGSGAFCFTTSCAMTSPALTTPSIGGDTVSAGPRGFLSGFIPGNLSATTGPVGPAYIFLDKAITVTRFGGSVGTAPNACTTQATITVQTASTLGGSATNLAITASTSNGNNYLDSGAVSVNVASGLILTFDVTTAAATCTTLPANLNMSIEYRMQ